jgi:hypothetical protein
MKLLATGAASCAALSVPFVVGASPSGATSLPVLTPQPFAAGDITAAPPQAKPDDIAVLGGNLYVTYQNGVGPDSSPSSTGVFQSTVVEYSPAGAVVQSWLLLGRCDGLGADPLHNRVLASVNEDNNSSLFSITPGNPTPFHYSYYPNPSQLAGTETSPNGGTDSISVTPEGTVYIAHSNPDPGVPNTAAVYTVRLSGTNALLKPVFRVNSTALDVVTHKSVKLALTDPDSNRLIPAGAPVLPGAFLQDSQGDGQVIIKQNGLLERLVLKNLETPTLQPTIDDIVEVTGPGTLYVVDQGANTVQTIDTSGFTPGTLVIAQPADTTTTPVTVGQLGVLDPTTGVITHFPNTFNSPKGLVFVPAG